MPIYDLQEVIVDGKQEIGSLERLNWESEVKLLCLCLCLECFLLVRGNQGLAQMHAVLGLVSCGMDRP